MNGSKCSGVEFRCWQESTLRVKPLVNNMAKRSRFLILFLIFFSLLEALPQAEPPTSWLMPPKDLWAFSYQYLDLESNVTPSVDVVLGSGTINAYVNAIPIVRSFALGNRIAQVFVVPTFGNLTASVDLDDIPGFGDIEIDPIEIIDKTGMMDSQVNFRIGLHNAPALNIIELSQWERKFQVYGFFGVTLPTGEYTSGRRINLGANRWAFRFGVPMVMPLNQNRKKPADLEFHPNITFFTNNNDPFVGDTKKQKPLLRLNTAVTKYFTSKFYGSLGAGYQYGAVTQIDDLPEGERLEQLGAGITGGYTFLSIIRIQATLGQVFFNDRNGLMARFQATVVLPSKSDRELLKQAGQQAKGHPSVFMDLR